MARARRNATAASTPERNGRTGRRKGRARGRAGSDGRLAEIVARYTSDLVNACAKNGLLVDGLWEFSPSYEGGEPGSADELERQLPAFLEIRARRAGLATSRPDRVARRAVRPAGAGRRSTRRTATRSR